MSQPTKNQTSPDEELGEYEPFEHRDLEHPTSDLDTLIHLLKGCIGCGVLAMPLAFSNAGLYFGLVCIFIVGFICTYCVHILLENAHALCKRGRVPSLGYAELAEASFLAGPPIVSSWASFAKGAINLFLIAAQMGTCSVYVLFVSVNVKQVVDYYTDTSTHQRLEVYMACLLPLLIMISLIRKLKFLSPVSMVANLLIATGLSITFYYYMVDLPPFSDVPKIVSIIYLPKFFGAAIFALEGIAVIMPLENNMEKPSHFITCPGVLHIGMSIVVLLYAVMGFFGFWRYGDKTEACITLNVPQEPLGQSVKLMIALAIILTYALQFYVPLEIIWKGMKDKFTNRPLLAEYCLRISLVTLTVVCAITVPNLGALISLVGALCYSMLGLIFPPIIDIVTFYEDPGFGPFKWRLFRNIFLLLFGFVGFATGTYYFVSVNYAVFCLLYRAFLIGNLTNKLIINVEL